MTLHSLDETRFAAALVERGWKLDASHGWIKSALRTEMERDWREALLAAVRCPYEPKLCDECNHPIEKHGANGCTSERSVQIEASSETQTGPCGCQAYEAMP